MIYARATIGSSALLYCSEKVNFISITLKWAVIVTSQGQGLHSSSLLPLGDNVLQRQYTPKKTLDFTQTRLVKHLSSKITQQCKQLKARHFCMLCTRIANATPLLWHVRSIQLWR